MDHTQLHQHDTGRYASRSKWVLVGFLLIGGFFLFTEHRAHILGILPYLLLLACPLMHLFHHGHGHHDHQEGNHSPSAKDAPTSHEETKKS